MSNQQRERLYKLLPSIYRQRDAAQGEPLRALLAVIEAEMRAVEADIDALYDNWFIETCDEWAVPYIADLLGIADLSDPRRTVYSQRVRVARTLGYQRRKGRPDTLRQIAQDVSGWAIRVVEYAALLSRAQHVQHPRLDQGRNASINGREVVRLGGLLDRSAYRPDMRRIAGGRGRHNLGNVGVFVWRLRSYPLTTADRSASD